MLENYLKDIKNLPILTEEEERQMWENPTQENKEKIILSNVRLVIYIAKKLFPNNGKENYESNLEYLIQEGNLGLLYAQSKFNYQKGYRFTTYAYNWIYSYIQRAIYAHFQGLVRKPVHIVEQLIIIYKTKIKLLQEIGDDPTAEEISAEIDDKNLTPQKVQTLLDLSNNELSLDQTYNDEANDAPLINAIGDDNTNETIHHNELKTMLLKAIKEELNPMAQNIVCVRFGVGDEFENDPHTLEETAEILYNRGVTKTKLSKERIRQIENKAMDLLRKNPAIRDLLKNQ